VLLYKTIPKGIFFEGNKMKVTEADVKGGIKSFVGEAENKRLRERGPDVNRGHISGTR